MLLHLHIHLGLSLLTSFTNTKHRLKLGILITGEYIEGFFVVFFLHRICYFANH